MRTLVYNELTHHFWDLVEERKLNSYFFKDSPYSEVECLIVKTATKVNSSLLDNFPNLKLIICAATGYDNIDLKAAKQRGIVVCHTPEANSFSAAEHTVSLIYALLKHHQLGQYNIDNDKWRKGLPLNWEMSELKALIIGVGRIGTKVADTIKLLGGEVRGVDPYLTEQDWATKQIEQTDYSQGLEWCNLISYHTPLTTETKDYFSTTTLTKLKRPVWLVNTARGGVVNELALKEGLDSGLILAAGLDVYDNEPILNDNLKRHPKVLVTPHTGAYTDPARRRTAAEILKVWESYVYRNTIINEV